MEHILGPIPSGRDVAIRILKGTEAFFFPGLFAALIAVILGGVGGAFAGYSQGVIRSGVMGLIQLFDTLPRLVFIILVCSVFEPTIYLIAVVTGVLFAPAIATIIRERVEALASEDYILAHVAHGFRPLRILLYHILWLQCRSVLVRQAAFVFCYVLFIETALSYLGHYGVQEPMPSWGNMIAQGNLSIHDGPNTPDPWHWMSPALAIVFTISGFLSFWESTCAVGRGGCAMTTAMLHVKDLVVEFDTSRGRRRVVDGVSFRLDKGEVVGILGESGSGKTVSTLAALGLVDGYPGVISGQVILNDDGHEIDLLRDLDTCVDGAGERLTKNVRRWKRIVRKRMRHRWGRVMTAVFQNPKASADPLQTIGQQVEESIRLAHPKVSKLERRDRAIDWLARGTPQPTEARPPFICARTLRWDVSASDDCGGFVSRT